MAGSKKIKVSDDDMAQLKLKDKLQKIFLLKLCCIAKPQLKNKIDEWTGELFLFPIWQEEFKKLLIPIPA